MTAVLMPVSSAQITDSAGRFTFAGRDLLRKIVTELQAQIDQLSAADANMARVLASLTGADGNLLDLSGLNVDELAAIAAVQTPGLMVRDALGQWFGRTMADTGTVAWTNADGTNGAPSATVPDKAITYAKIQDVSARSVLLGRGASGAGDPQEIALGTGLTMTGTTLSAASGTSAWTTVNKTADESRSNTTTLANDSHLSFACSAAATYVVRLRALFGVANGTMDFKYGCAYSGTIASSRRLLRHSDPGKAGGTSFEFAGYGAGITGSVPLATAASEGQCSMEFVFTTTTAGTLSFQWAQNTLDPASATVYRGSYLEYMTS